MPLSYPPTANQKYILTNFSESTPENTVNISKSLIPIIDNMETDDLENVTMIPRFRGWRDYFEASIISESNLTLKINEGIFVHNNVLIHSLESVEVSINEIDHYLYSTDSIPSTDGTYYIYTAIRHDRTSENPDISIGLITPTKYTENQTDVYVIQVIETVIDGGSFLAIDSNSILNSDPSDASIGRGEWYTTNVDGKWIGYPITY